MALPRCSISPEPCGRIAQGAATLRPLPLSPARPEGLQGESRSACRNAPQTCGRRGGGVPAARWVRAPRGSGGGALEFSPGSRQRPHSENCRASSQQGREGAPKRDARTLACGHFARKRGPPAPWGEWGVAVLGRGGLGGLGEGAVRLPAATKRGWDGNVAKLTLNLQHPPRRCWGAPGPGAGTWPGCLCLVLCPLAALVAPGQGSVAA